MNGFPIVHNFNNTVKMVWHYHKRVIFGVRILFKQPEPGISNDFALCVQYYHFVAHLPKAAHAMLHHGGDEKHAVFVNDIWVARWFSFTHRVVFLVFCGNNSL
jgi:hypothetical protein